MNQSAMLSLQTGAVERLCRLSLRAHDDGFVVQVARGRRGTALQTENKTPGPVAYEYARRIYASLFSKMTAQGYVIVPSASSAHLNSPPVYRTPLRPQRPVPLAVAEAGALIADPGWWMQENYRGRHVLISKMGGEIIATDADGAIVPLPAALTSAIDRVPLRFILEGVLDKAAFTVFDLPQFETILYRSLPYDVRLAGLRSLLPESDPHLTIAATATELAAKVELLHQLRHNGKVGFVLKRRNGGIGSEAAGAQRQCRFEPR